MANSVHESIPRFKAVVIFIYALLLLFISGSLIIYPSTLKYIYPDSFPPLKDSVTMLVSLYIVLYYSLQIPAGLLIDRTSINVGIFLSLIFCCIGLLFFAASHSLAMFILARVISAIGSSFTYILAVLVARELFASKWFTTLVGLSELSFAFSIASSPYIFKGLSFSFSWPMASLFFALCIFILLMLFFIFKLPKHIVIKDKSTFAEKNIFLHLKRIIGYVFWYISIMAGIFYTHFTVFTEINAAAYLQKVYGVSYMDSVGLNNTALFGYMLGCLLLGTAERLLKPRLAFFSAALLSTLFYTIIAFYHPLLLGNSIIKPVLYFMLGFFSPFALLAFPLYQMLSGKALNATTNACISLVVFLTPLGLMNIYMALWHISFADTRYFMFACYAFTTILGFGLFLHKKAQSIE